MRRKKGKCWREKRKGKKRVMEVDSSRDTQRYVSPGEFSLWEECMNDGTDDRVTPGPTGSVHEFDITDKSYLFHPAGYFDRIREVAKHLNA